MGAFEAEGLCGGSRVVGSMSRLRGGRCGGHDEGMLESRVVEEHDVRP